ncbi:MAG: toll/interleukin-1 receptor domain-containing protein [Planococcus citreus]
MAENFDLIFISHSHKDAKYAEQLLKLLKVTKIEEQGIKIICTSAPGYGVPGDENIYDFLSEQLSGKAWVIYLLSENYYESAACLNEMGATWVMKNRYSTFLTPNFSYSDLRGAIDLAKHGFKLNDKSRLNDFKNLLIKDLDTEKVDDNIWESVRDEALLATNQAAALEKSEIEKKKTHSVKLESVKSCPENQIKVAIRCINNTKYNIELSYFKLTLIDDEGNKFVKEVEPSEIYLNTEENKIFFLVFPLEESQYSARRHNDVFIENSKFSTMHIGGL